MQMILYNFRYIFLFEKYRQKYGVLTARAAPLLQTLLITSIRAGGPVVFTFSDLTLIIFSEFFAMLDSRHRSIME